MKHSEDEEGKMAKTPIEIYPVVPLDDLGDAEIRRLREELRIERCTNAILMIITLLLSVAVYMGG